MGRPKGLAKTGGRKLGTPNKNSQALSERLESLGCDPIEGLAKIALDPATKPELKVRCFAELAQYVYPNRKAVDLALNEGDEGPGYKVVVEYIGRPDRSSETNPQVRPTTHLNGKSARDGQTH